MGTLAIDAKGRLTNLNNKSSMRVPPYSKNHQKRLAGTILTVLLVMSQYMAFFLTFPFHSLFPEFLSKKATLWPSFQYHVFPGQDVEENACKCDLSGKAINGKHCTQAERDNNGVWCRYISVSNVLAHDLEKDGFLGVPPRRVAHDV